MKEGRKKEIKKPNKGRMEGRKEERKKETKNLQKCNNISWSAVNIDIIKNTE